MLTSAKSTSCWFGNDISVKNKRQGLQSQRYSAAVDDYRCMEGLISDVDLQ
jgi:hypothetical protein